MTQHDDPLKRALEDFQSVTQKPENYLNVDESLTKTLKKHLKTTYDFAKKEEIKSRKSGALPELIIEHFDCEQIWQQIELQNDAVLPGCLPNISRLLVKKDQLLFKSLEEKYKAIENEKKKEEEGEDKLDGDEDDEDQDDDDLDDKMSDIGDNDDEDDDGDQDEDQAQSQNGFKKKSIVDDKFFKLSEMEEFLNKEEKKLNNPDSGNDSEESDEDDEDNDSVDLFQAMSEDEDPVRVAKYKDFFVEKVEDKQKPIKRNKFLEELGSDDDDDDEGEQHIPKSSLELRQERLKKKIEEFEEDAVGEKPWQLKGEITAENRPQNSLLEEVVEFDMTTRPAPVMTEQTSMQLEDIIRQRIKDKVFDSVERKEKPVESLLEYKKKLVLDQEKSKQSLAQIYEKEYLDQQAALDPENANKEEEEPALHKEIKSMMSSLFTKLDALSNFHFTPKPAIPELKIISNLPAISMEEVAPVAMSDAQLLAPEEIKNKTKGEQMGKGEKTKTDKNRERRKKKQKQRIHVKEKEKRQALVNKMNPGLGNKYSKEKAKKMLEKVTKDSNVDKMDQTGKSVKSSKAFFTQLQDEVQSHISNKVHKTKKMAKPKVSATKIKL